MIDSPVLANLTFPLSDGSQGRLDFLSFQDSKDNEEQLMSKTVLMIVRNYYPSNSSGAHRPAKMAKYLPCFGWTPVVVCKKYTSKDLGGTYDPQLAAVPDVCKVVRVNHPLECRVTRKLERTFWNLFGGGPHDYRYPLLLYNNIKQAAGRTIVSQHFDAIWASSLPGFVHKVADHWSQKYNIPWVADFRDLPDQFYETRNTQFALKQEIKICSSAKALIATTDEQAEKLRKRHSIPVYSVLNGYDPSDFSVADQFNQLDKKFTINHFGILYEFRDPSCLFDAVDRLVKASTIDLQDIEINFYGAGAHRKTVEGLARRYTCSACVHVPDRVPYPEMIKRQLESQILLVVASPGQGGAIPAKLYGYLASKRPILNVPGDGMGTDWILHQTRAGVTFFEPEQIASWLEKAYYQWKQQGFVPFSGDGTEIEKYSRKTQAGQVAEILDTITSL